MPQHFPGVQVKKTAAEAQGGHGPGRIELGQTFRAIVGVVVIAAAVPCGDAGRAPGTFVVHTQGRIPASTGQLKGLVLGGGSAEARVVLQFAHIHRAVAEFGSDVEGGPEVQLGGKATPVAVAPGIVRTAVDFFKGAHIVAAAAQHGHEAAAGRVNGGLPLGGIVVDAAQAVFTHKGVHAPGGDLEAGRGDGYAQPEHVQIVQIARFVLAVLGQIRIVVVRTSPEKRGSHLGIAQFNLGGAQAYPGGVLAVHGAPARYIARQQQGLHAHAHLEIGFGQNPVKIGVTHAQILRAVRAQGRAVLGRAPVHGAGAHGKQDAAGEVFSGHGVDLRAQALNGAEGVPAAHPPGQHVGRFKTDVKSAFDFEIHGIGRLRPRKKDAERGGQGQKTTGIVHVTSCTFKNIPSRFPRHWPIHACGRGGATLRQQRFQELEGFFTNYFLLK